MEFMVWSCLPASVEEDDLKKTIKQKPDAQIKTLNFLGVYVL